jgi:hypothetical protein
MPGFTWGVYASDDGHDYLMQVDLDLYVMLERGWEPPIPESYLPQYPRRWKARHVVGLGPEGQRRVAVCATTSCSLWSLLTPTFRYRDTNGIMLEATVIERIGEKRVKPHL